MLSTDIGSLNCSHVVQTRLLIDVNNLIWILDARLESRPSESRQRVRQQDFQKLSIE
jgi:hypothetical protein